MPQVKVIFQLRGLPALPEDVQITGFGLEKTVPDDAQADDPVPPAAPEPVCP